MTSDGSDTLDLAYMSKRGQSVSRYTHRFFLFEFFCQREDIFVHFIGHNFKLEKKRVREKELNKEEFLHFFIDF